MRTAPRSRYMVGTYVGVDVKLMLEKIAKEEGYPSMSDLIRKIIMDYLNERRKKLNNKIVAYCK